jgi:hypothetical protein
MKSYLYDCVVKRRLAVNERQSLLLPDGSRVRLRYGNIANHVTYFTLDHWKMCHCLPF